MAKSYTLAGSSGIAHVDRVDDKDGAYFAVRGASNEQEQRFPADSQGDRDALRLAIQIAFGRRRS